MAETVISPTAKAPIPGTVITLGTAGGPRWWHDSDRTGIATALVVDDGFYLIDCGHHVGRQIERAGLALKDLKGVFITHLHSDHIVDLNSLAVFGLYVLEHRLGGPIPIIGPGDRGALPPVSSLATSEPTPISPEAPTPGITVTFRRMVEAHATDLNDRILDSLRPSPLDLFEAQDIVIPADIGYHPNERPTPTMAPFVVYSDDQVTVSATLVEHPPIAPAFAFRFDTAYGSVVISGDTTYTQNMVAISHGADLLLHEAIDFDHIEQMYGGLTDDVSLASKEHHYKSHTSAVDAQRIAAQAGVGMLALHHLVPGRQGSNGWERDIEIFDGEFVIPADLDRIALPGSERTPDALGTAQHHEPPRDKRPQTAVSPSAARRLQ